MTSACSEQNQLSECIEGDCINGYGTATIASGDKYVIVMKVPVNLIHPDANKELKFNNFFHLKLKIYKFSLCKLTE